MSLGRKLIGGLEGLRGAGGVQTGGTVEVHESKCRASVQVREFDKLAVSIDRMDVWTTVANLPSDKIEQVMESQARRIERRIGYLVEGLTTLEFDRGDKVIQMRSAEPFSERSERRYFELILAGGCKATLRRYKGSEKDSGRQPVSMNLTMEVLERLADDLSAALTARSV